MAGDAEGWWSYGSVVRRAYVNLDPGLPITYVYIIVTLS